MDFDLDRVVKTKKIACMVLGIEQAEYDATEGTGSSETYTYTDASLKKAYRKKALEWHPDRAQNHSYKEDATLMFQKVQESFNHLEAILKKRSEKGGRKMP